MKFAGILLIISLICGCFIYTGILCLRASRNGQYRKKARSWLIASLVCFVCICILAPIADAVIREYKIKTKTGSDEKEPFIGNIVRAPSELPGFWLSDARDEMLSYGTEQFHREETTIDDFNDLLEELDNEFERKRSIVQEEKMPDDVVLPENVPFQDYTPKTLEECDELIACAWHNAEEAKTDKGKARYYEIAARRAKDGISLCGDEKSNDEKGWGYARIAYRALVNVYIYSDYHTPKESDLFYILSQTYDYLGKIADTEDLQYRMYFLSAAFADMAYTLRKNEFFSENDVIYNDSVWNHYFMLLYRMGLYLDTAERASFYSRACDCWDEVKSLSLSKPSYEKVRKWLEPMQTALGRAKEAD